MPTYVYACKNCQHRFEIFQSFSDKTLRKCPDCGEKALGKVIFPAGVLFKGSGFYVNDSKGSGSETAATDKSAATTESGSSETGSTKTESSDSTSSDSVSGDSDSGDSSQKTAVKKKEPAAKKKAPAKDSE
jgi:putative FmdB family regulatory protein